MSESIKRMLADRAKSDRAHEAGLRRELNRRIVEAAKQRFTSSFTRQQRFYRERHDTSRKVPGLALDAQAVCEGADLAQDPGWDAERAWRFSVTRERAVAQVEQELERCRQ